MNKVVVALGGLMALTLSPAGAREFPAPLPVERIPAVESLPARYPSGWMLIQDLFGPSILDGRVAIVDTTSPDQPLRGVVRAAQMANVLYAPDKGEIYTAETFYPRLTRGERTDAITIWDTATLKEKGEILLPGGKRQLSAIYPNVFQFTNNGQWALVYNFTPAQSVTVVDLGARRVLGEIDLPGCTQIYPTGTRGFSTLCADGSMSSITLDAAGGVAATRTLPKVQDIDHQPMFAIPALVGRTSWFVTYHGELHGFDLSGDFAKKLPKVATVGTAPGGDPEWRPGGWQVITSDARGLLYVLMSPHGKEGSHKSGGTEVWVVDPVRNIRVRRMPIRGVGVSIAVTREPSPRLVVVRGDDASVDVYDAASGELVHSLGNRVAMSPWVLVTVQ